LIPLPSYLSRETWDEFEIMRMKMRKPLTDRARKLILYELQRIKEAGHCPNAALDQSILHCWADVYQPKEKQIESNANAVLEQSKQYLQSQLEHARLAREERKQRGQA
jgi:hypothetical protein